RPAGSLLTPTAGARAEPAALELTGAVSGALTEASVTCAPPGATILIGISGKLKDKPYGIQINTLETGTFKLGEIVADPPAVILLSDQSVTGGAVPRWSAGLSDTKGNGTLQIR